MTISNQRNSSLITSGQFKETSECHIKSPSNKLINQKGTKIQMHLSDLDAQTSICLFKILNQYIIKIPNQSSINSSVCSKVKLHFTAYLRLKHNLNIYIYIKYCILKILLLLISSSNQNHYKLSRSM